MLTRDHRLALLDLGMVGHLSPNTQERLLKLLVAIAEGHGDAAADLVLRLGAQGEGFDGSRFRRQIADVVARFQGRALSEIQVGRVVLEVARAASDGGVQVPPEMTLLGKTLLNLDQVGRALDPDFDPNESVRRNAGEILRRKVLRSASPGNLVSTLVETKEFMEQLPGRVNRILETIANNELRLDVDAIDEEQLIRGIQKIANRIAVGLIVAALIVGAALMMRVATEFRLFGYPGVAMILFLVAAAGGVAILWQILVADARDRRRRPR